MAINALLLKNGELNELKPYSYWNPQFRILCVVLSNLFWIQKKFDHSPGIFLDNSSGFLLAIDPVESFPILPSWYHIRFCLENEAEVIRIYDRMKSDGVSIARDLMKEPNEFASFFVLDPDGYKIEVNWHDE
jgi:hypothetical protein